MSKSKRAQKKVEKQIAVQELSGSPKVQMMFGKEVFFKSQTVPHFLPGKVYDVEARSVDKWLKRGGQIVTGEMLPIQEPVESSEENTEDVVID